MSDRRWRIEKIHDNHPAHENNPLQYPLGCWYATDDPDEEHDGWWREFCVPTWSAAITMIHRLDKDLYA